MRLLDESPIVRSNGSRSAQAAHKQHTSPRLLDSHSARVALCLESNEVESTAISFRLSAARPFREPREFGSGRSAARRAATRLELRKLCKTRRGPAGPRRLRSSCCRCSGRYPIGSNRIRSGHRISGDGVRRVPADCPGEAGARGARTERSGLIFHPIHRA